MKKLHKLQIISKLVVITPLTTIALLMRNFIANFVRILGICKDFAGNRVNELGNVPRCGVVPKFSDLEVVALGITVEAFGFDSENLLFHRLRHECKDDLPNQISRRQFNVRRKLTPRLAEEIRKEVAVAIDGSEDVFCIDSKPVKVCQNDGPVQIAFGKSLDPVLPLDISITRMAAALGGNDKSGKKTYEEYEEEEQKTPEDELRTMGRKQIIPFGLYEVRGFISANLAAETGFDEADMKALFEAILNMYEHDRSASKGEMEVVSPLIIFKHEGTDTNPEQRARQAKLGCAPAHKLFELVTVQKKVDFPRNYRDYEAKVALDKVPAGVRMGFLSNPYGEIVWDELPQGESWFTRG